MSERDERKIEESLKQLNELVNVMEGLQLKYQKEIAKESLEKAKSIITKIEELEKKAKANESQSELRNEFIKILNEFHVEIAQYQGFLGFEREVKELLEKGWFKVFSQIDNFLRNNNKQVGIQGWGWEFLPQAIVSTFKVIFR